MEIVTILWSAGAGSAIALSAMCGWVWVVERRSPAMLMLCLLGAAAATSAHFEIGMMKSLTPAEYGEWVQWYHLPTYVALLAQVFFVHYYLRTDRRWLLWTFVVVRTVVLVTNFSVHPNLAFSSIDSLNEVTLLGEPVSIVGEAVPNGLQSLAVVSLILLMTYLIDAVIEGWLKGDDATKRKASAVALGIVVPLLGTITYTQLLVFGFVHAPLTNAFWYLGTLLLMAVELGRDFIQRGRMQAEAAELRSTVSRVERAAVLGQLASALAHELTQPLQAMTANLAAARKHLSAEKPNVNELREILDDVDSDQRRSKELIARLRTLFPQTRPIDLQAVQIEDVLGDVVSLVRAEASSKSVVIDLVVPMRLPRVSADRVQLSQVLLNLLANGIDAVESRPPDARRIVVEVQATDENREVEIIVRDSGPGIPSALGDNIFKPFFSTKLEGVSMGLALSRSIIEAHGGQLWADEVAPEKGAVFHLTLRPA